MIVTIDGPSGTGKSTVAKSIAESLKITYLDTGAMYRSFAWYLISKSLPLNESSLTEEIYLGFHLEIKDIEGSKVYFVNDKDVTLLIRSREVTKASSEVAKFPSLRNFIVALQRKWATSLDIILEGRDTGSVVFPNADVKIYLTAKEIVRAKRRFDELKRKGDIVNLQAILEEQKARDSADSTREHSPLVCPIDAHVIDTSNMNSDQVVQKAISIIAAKGKKGFSFQKIFFHSILFIMRSLFRFFYNIEVIGKENLQEGPAILACNHVSFLDPPLVGCFSGCNTHFLARSSLFRHFIFGKLISFLNAHPISGNAQDMELFDKVDAIFDLGEKVVMFPEGKRSRDGHILPFKRGIGFIIEKSCPVVYPVYIDGAYEIWSRNHRWPKLFKKIDSL
jgi:cytidylate kinase